MLKLMMATVAAAVTLQVAVAGAAPLYSVGERAPGSAIVLVAGKKNGVIPANCTMDPYKKVYVCCDGPNNCKEYPLDHDWPVVRQQLFKVTPRLQPMTLQPAPQ